MDVNSATSSRVRWHFWGGCGIIQGRRGNGSGRRCCRRCVGACRSKGRRRSGIQGPFWSGLGRGSWRSIHWRRSGGEGDGGDWTVGSIVAGFWVRIYTPSLPTAGRRQPFLREAGCECHLQRIALVHAHRTTNDIFQLLRRTNRWR